MKALLTLLPVILALGGMACSSGDPVIDASGRFEAVETIVSTEATGTIREFTPEEGQTLRAGQSVGYVDSTQLLLRKKQLASKILPTLSQKPDIAAQIAALEVQAGAAGRS